MKVTSKVVMLNVEHQIAVGNDAITATVIHQVCLSKGEEDEIFVDVDLMDITDIEFLGIKIDNGYTEFQKFKTQMNEMGVDVDALINEECVGLITTGDIQKLKNEYKDLVK
jgi:hypothetical protein